MELADTLVAEFDVIDFLHTLARRSVELLDADAVGIMLTDERGGVHPVASSTEEAQLSELYELQNAEGPCMDCLRSGQPASRDDLRSMRDAWPAFTERLETLGFHSARAIPMRLRTEVIGALNILRTAPDPLSLAHARLGQAFADVAAVGLIQERVMTASGLAEQLQAALNSRIVLEQAKGILAERIGLPMDGAFQLMRDHARGRGERLIDVAVSIIQGNLAEALDPSRQT